ncbi:MAG: chloride channel protein [Planctomycetota bacterium]|nr:MAG: chloride channel protein [Planctomycetota bacterium]
MEQIKATLQWLGDLIYNLDVRSHGKWFLLSLWIGVVAGIGAIAFQYSTQAVATGVLARVSGWHSPEPHGEPLLYEVPDAPFRPWLLVVVCAVGGIASGLLVHLFAPEAAGHGTDAAIEAFHRKGGLIRARVPIVKTIASAITLGTGGSAGREGPIAQIGAGFGSYLASKLGMTARDRRIMLAAGMGAGVGAIFRAPLAGALFAAEILYSDAEFESDVIVPATMSSIVAYLVYCQSLPEAYRFLPLFGNQLRHSMSGPAELIPYAVLGIVLMIVGAIYVGTFYQIHAWFDKLPVWRFLRPGIGAALAALIGVGLWYAWDGEELALSVMATGYAGLQTALLDADSIGIRLLVAIALLKILTTSLTIGSGGSGGVFGPSMVIGGCTGAACGLWFHQWMPGVVPQAEPFALVGMAGFFAGLANAPISTIIMVSEMTGDYKLLLPTTFCSTICFVVGRKINLYRSQVPSRMESPAHRGDFIIDILEGMKVRDVYRKDLNITLIDEGMPLEEIVHRVADDHQHYYPVVDREGRMVGIFSSDDVRAYLYNESIWQLAVARDVMISNFLYVTPDDDLNSALEEFTQLNVDELPVVDAENHQKFLGMLRRKELIATYNRRLMELKRQKDEQ